VPHFKLVGVLLPKHDSYGGNVNFFLKVWHIKVKEKIKGQRKEKECMVIMHKKSF
jgi:hypothetical protein